ncbi:conserved domain protein [Paraprevotella xylaniphila YIT 11841]|uniref:Conserved domain protein n=1 Tax=Paraprevotella xylaniphila YIT 11841 TaxID=762982 RepID=F3QSM2_9BACT|nr:DUF2829 domain-containing protein [Paraprevotella xylaniphila]EGG55309.1 conserved domain protein [Paraprevotella xylaniphila YIT 11841]
MKKYIGTKQIEAEPMTMGDAYEKGLLQAGKVPNENEKSNAGYHVRYQDGYESWSPAEPFEKAYKCADTFIDRLYIEYSDLIEKFEKCATFVDSDKFREVVKDDYPAFLLSLQRDLMGRYLQALSCRINIADNITEDVSIQRMSFGIAIQALKFGLAIRRKGWNGKGLFVIKQVPAHIGSDVIPKMQSLPQSAKDLILSGKGFIDYTSQCLIYNENTGRADSWVPSISDVFAEDWEIVK